MKAHEAFPKFKDGWIVIDTADAPMLKNAIGSRIYRSRTAAAAAIERVRSFLDKATAARIQVVEVDGSSPYYKLGYVDASDVTVNDRGEIRMRGAR